MVCTADSLGIVFPVYMLGVPLIVVDFLKKLKTAENTYTFVVANHGACPGPGGTVLQTKKLLKAQGIKLGAIFTIEMINNYTPFFGIVKDEKQKKVFDRAQEQVKIICETVNNKGIYKPGNFFGNIFSGLLSFVNQRCVPLAVREDKKFWTDEKCTGCGICVKVCPVGNVKLSGGKPVWLHNCRQCVACFSLCPEQAIQLGKKSQNSGRYKNPEVTLEDIVAANSYSGSCCK